MNELAKIPADESKKYKKLFGKHPVADISFCSDKVIFYVGEDSKCLYAIADYGVTDEGNYYFSGNFPVNIKGASVPRFKEIYADAKDHFRRKGVSVDGFVDEEEKVKGAHFLSSSCVLAWNKKKQMTPEGLVDMTREMSIAVDKWIMERYPEYKEELANCGAFGGLTSGSKIWTPEGGIYVAMEAPLTDSCPYALNMQFNCREMHEPARIIELRDAIFGYLQKGFPQFVGDELSYDPSHRFRIDLREISKKHPELSSGLEQALLP